MNTKDCFAVIFTSQRSDSKAEEYDQIAKKMALLAQKQEGFLGLESARSEDGQGITVSYWRSMEDIKAWHEHGEHRLAQKKGREEFYLAFKVRICRVEREYEY